MIVLLLRLALIAAAAWICYVAQAAYKLPPAVPVVAFAFAALLIIKEEP